MKYLIVVAHPDDEVLGAGATICRLNNEGNDVAICTLVSSVSARSKLSSSLSSDREKAMAILGVDKANLFDADFPNIKLNTVPQIDLVQFIEGCIEKFGAQAVITHHPTDTNIDHQETSRASQAAVRLFQRKTGIPRLNLFMYMEVPSSTDWSLDSSSIRFIPNYYVEIGESGVVKKLEALKAYSGVMRTYPHPRSEEAIKGLAAYRGAQSGSIYAESFDCVFQRL